MGKRSVGVVLALGLLVAGIAWSSRAGAQARCRREHGRYVLTPTTEGCASGTCFTGELTGAGLLNGAVRVTLLGSADYAGLTTESGLVGNSYFGDTVLTTGKGTMTFRNVGLFATDPNADIALQSEIGVVTDGTGQFASAIGHLTSTGAAAEDGSLRGELAGEICLEP